MRSSTKSLLTLFEWSSIIGMHPFYLAQIGEGVPARSRGDCQDVMYQNAFQNSDHLSREEIAEAIAQAEDLFAKNVGYYPAPKYIADEPHLLADSGYDYYYWRYRKQTIQTKYGHVQAVGSEALTLADSEVSVVLSDTYSNGIDDTFTVTATVPSGTQASAICAFFKESDRGLLSLQESEIKPLLVSISGTTATIKGHITLLVKPVQQLTLDPISLDATDNTIYADEIDIYTRAVDITDQGSLIWNNGCDCNGACEATLSDACFQTKSMELGILAPVFASWDADIENFVASYPCCAMPERVKVNYYAGYPRQDNGRMDQENARIIALLATALLPNRTCGCGRADQRLLYYRDPPTNDQNQIIVSPQIVDDTAKAFGVTGRGAIEAYRLMLPLVQWSAVQFNGRNENKKSEFYGYRYW